MRILIVDDAKFLRERLIRMIEELPGKEVVGEAESVEEAVEDVERTKPDAVILDIKLSGGSGIEVLKKIRRKKDGPFIVVLTNYPFTYYRKKCMEEGADFFFDKAEGLEQVTAALKELQSRKA